MKNFQIGTLFIGLAMFVACGGQTKESNETEQTADAHEHPAGEHPTADSDGEASGIAEMIAAPEGARVFFVNLEDGAVVSSPVKVEMGSEGIKVQPAGEIVEGTGHHHIIINEGPSPYGVVVGADDTHIHFGKGQEETELELAPGKYTLTLQFADGFHRSYGDSMSSTITIEVQ
jgi:hypothetical protein